MTPMQRLNKGIYDMTHDTPNYLDYLDYLDSIAENTPEDEVNAPKHYMLMPGVEVRDVIAALTEKIEVGIVEFTGQDYGDYVQLMQYLMRFMDKGGLKDLEKARWYLDKLIENYDEY